MHIGRAALSVIIKFEGDNDKLVDKRLPYFSRFPLNGDLEIGFFQRSVFSNSVTGASLKYDGRKRLAKIEDFFDQ